MVTLGSPLTHAQLSAELASGLYASISVGTTTFLPGQQVPTDAVLAGLTGAVQFTYGPGAATTMTSATANAASATLIVNNVPAQLFPAQPSRAFVRIRNQDAQFPFWLFPPGWSPPTPTSPLTPWVVTNGVLIGPGESEDQPYAGERWAAVDPATADFSAAGSGISVSVTDYFG